MMRLSVRRPGALALMAALAFVLRGSLAFAQDSSTTVRIGLTYAPGTKPGVLVLPVNGMNGDSVRAILQRDLDFGDRANVIAWRLIADDVSPGDLVGILLNRTVDLVATMIAVGKVGAAFLPLDPQHPDDRLAFMAADSGCSLLVTDGDRVGRLVAIHQVLRRARRRGEPPGSVLGPLAVGARHGVEPTGAPTVGSPGRSAL